MKPGWNCAINYYNPLKNKQRCTKCIIPGSSLNHELSCTQFVKFNSEVCKECRRGMHFEKDCSNSRPNNYSTSDDSLYKRD